MRARVATRRLHVLPSLCARVLRRSVHRCTLPTPTASRRPTPALQVVAVGDIVPADALAYLLRWDSVQGAFKGAASSRRSAVGDGAHGECTRVRPRVRGDLMLK